MPVRLDTLIQMMEMNIESAEREVRAVGERLKRMGDDAIAFADGERASYGAMSDQGDLAYWIARQPALSE